MVLDNGAAKELAAETGAPAPDRVPLTPAHRQGVIDPISALLVPINGAYDVLAADVCQRTLPVFDGRRRYDLKLTFKRMDSVKAESGYAGPAVVCGIAFQPHAGHRASSTLVKYLSEGRDIELWLAPVSGTRVLAPFRASVASMLGNLRGAGDAVRDRVADRGRNRGSGQVTSFQRKSDTTDPVVLRASTSRCACAASRSG